MSDPRSLLVRKGAPGPLVNNINRLEANVPVRTRSSALRIADGHQRSSNRARDQKGQAVEGDRTNSHAEQGTDRSHRRVGSKVEKDQVKTGKAGSRNWRSRPATFAHRLP